VVKMAYTLRAIPDRHPVNILCNLLEDKQYIHPQFIEGVFAFFLKSCDLNPEIVAWESFWKFLHARVLRHVRNMVKEMDFSAFFEKDILQRFDKRTKVNFELVRRIYAHQFKELREGRYLRIYHEGYGMHPIERYALSNGLEFISLDEDNLYYLELDKRENKNLQKKSEGVWIDRITPSPAINNSLLIAGGEHINNGYGLITRLRRKGIIVNPLVPSDYYDVIGRKIYRESKRKK